MPVFAPSDLFAYLDKLGIAHDTTEHPATFSVAESGPIKASIPGAHSKNLFVKDKKGRIFLITAKDETRIDLKRAHETVGGSGRLSFCSAEQLQHYLGVEPGSVTPFGAVNDTERKVTVILDSVLMSYERVNFHPLVNTMTTGLSREDLVLFLQATGHEPRILDLPVPPDENLA